MSYTGVNTFAIIANDSGMIPTADPERGEWSWKFVYAALTMIFGDGGYKIKAYTHYYTSIR